MKSTTKQAKHFRSVQCQLRKIIASVLALIVIASVFSGCDNTSVSTDAGTMPEVNNHSYSKGSTINVGYSQDDSLNPFFLQTDINSDIPSLIYEPLFYVDDTFCARNGLAQSYTIAERTLTVKLDKSVAFSDGVQFSSADVIYSFTLAKQSHIYKDELSIISSATATSADTVVFSLNADYSNAVDSLSFPIVKTGTADDKDSFPIGTGLYKWVRTGEEIKLEYNPYCKKPQPKITSVELVKLTSASTLIHTLELGTIDVYFDDLSTGSYSQANARISRTNLTNLVFLGMNSNSYGLSSAAMRQAVYYSINRQSIVKNAFKNYAVESAVPYHPEWHVVAEAEMDLSDLSLNYSKAQTLMKNAGFNDTMNYNLIVYSGNHFKVAAAKLLQENFMNIGINLTIQELTWDGYKAALAAGNYDFYIGEIKLPRNMNMSVLFSDGSAVYGKPATDTTSTAYGEYINGKISLETFTLSFLQNMPFAPICFRSGALVYSNKITTSADCDAGNAYKNIYEWEKIN